MCGIVGFVEPSGEAHENRLTAMVQHMADQLIHRGPDAGGTWVDPSVGVALGHRRLSILDLSPQGQQPMQSSCGRYWVVFNGEIYNFDQLRAELIGRGHSFRGRSDTEVLLAAVSEWGIEAAIQRFNGMFALALWDHQERRLHLARDRMGEKPLYYALMSRTFLFGSELKALRAHPSFRAEVDRNALSLFLRYSYVPAPFSIYEGVYKLPPGTTLTFAPGSSPELSAPTTYWSMMEAVQKGRETPFLGELPEAIDHLEHLLRDSVRMRMEADVPLGAFLSGGVDSSTVVSLMQAQSDRAVKTFTIGFQEGGYNEASEANSVAKHLGTEHTELIVTPADALDVIPRLPTMYDEPFADSSQIPTFLVSQLARRDVIVALSGDGGDELFGGYNRYAWGPSVWDKVGWIPADLRSLAGKALTGVSPRTWNELFHRILGVFPRRLHQRGPGAKLQKLGEVIGASSPHEMYHRLVSQWKHPTDVALRSVEPPTIVTDRSRWADLPSFAEHMMYLDAVSYLPDDILVKVDRASMGVSLEARVPFLDHRVAEFAWTLPLDWKIREGKGKWLLRQVLYKYVPEALIERPKVGFGIPLDSWLRGPLREWAETLLSEKRLREEGYLDPGPVQRLWREHLEGRHNWEHYLWNVLMFQAWLEANHSASLSMDSHCIG